MKFKDKIVLIIGGASGIVRKSQYNLQRALKVGKALGINLSSVKDAMQKKYDTHGNSLYENIHDCKPYYDSSFSLFTKKS